MLARITRFVPALLFFTLLAAPLAAEVQVVRHDGPLPDRSAFDSAIQGERAALTDVNHKYHGNDKREDPATFFILPHLKIDDLFITGPTTALGIRNEAEVPNQIFVDIFPTDNILTAGNTLERTLQPKEVWTINLRGQTGTLPADELLFIRGLATVIAVNGPVSADTFQINSDQDFATGGALVDADNIEFCTNAKVRFLVGGAFSGGTQLFFVLDFPLGGDSMVDPPSVFGTAYREDGTVINTFEIFTDQFTFEIDAGDLVTDENFGSLDITYGNDGAGGFVTVEHKADNRYSVSLKQTCLDNLMPML